MSEEALSQQEVDGLLQGFSEQEPGETSPAAEIDNTPANINVADREFAIGKRLNALEAINERFIQRLKLAFADLLRAEIIVSSALSRAQKCGDFLQNLALPTNLNLVALQPLNGNALVVCEPSLIFAVIDDMFGGTGKMPAPFDGRAFSKTEQRIIRRLLAVVLDCYQQAWEPLYPLQFKFVRSEMHTSFIEFAPPNDVVVVTSLDVRLGDAGGEIRICIPYPALEPIRDQLEGTSSKQDNVVDRNWLQSLSEEIQAADVNLLANFASIPISLGQVLEMKPGDIIQFDMPKIVYAEADGVPIFECRYGTSNGKYALKIERVVALH